MTISGIISGSGGLTKTYVTGTANGGQALLLNLTGANTYSGPTTIISGYPYQGQIAITAANNLGDGSVTNGINLGGGLWTTGNIDLGVNRTVTIVGGSLAPAFNIVSGTLTVDGSFNNSANNVVTINGAGNLIISGAISEPSTGGRVVMLSYTEHLDAVSYRAATAPSIRNKGNDTT